MKKDLLSRWLALKDNAKKGEKGIKRSRFPLAYNQQSLHFLYQFYPENPFYNYLDYYHFSGNLNVDSLIKAFKAIIERHPIFRTRIVTEEGEPLQIEGEHGELEIFNHVLMTGTEEEAKAIIIADANRPFDLSGNKQLRLSITQYGSQDYAIGVIAHHILVDKWSMSMLRAEVAELYQQLSRNIKPQHKPIKYSYGQYAYDQVHQPIDKELIKYWVDKLGNDNDPINLPCDHLRPDQPTFKGKHFKVNLPNALSEAIKNQCNKLKVTPFVFLISAFKTLLYKYTRKSSFNIGVPFSNKQNAELESIIGFFDETVILHARIKDQKFAEFIETVSEEVYDVFDKKQVPLELLVKELKPDRISGINPLFQVMFIYHKQSKEPIFGDDLHFSSETLDTGVTKFDLSLFVGEDEHGFSCIFEYATDIFRQETIASYADHFINLLEQVSKNPQERITRLSLLSEADAHRIVNDWNSTAFEIDSKATILDKIDWHSNNSADKVAAVDGNKRVTYGELNSKANALSNFLTGNIPESGQIVGLHMGRSVEMVIAILGVLRSGHAYLPLDPEYPENRINHMIRDAGVSLIISSQPEIDYQNIKTYRLTDILRDKKPGTSPVQVLPSDIAYVIYTSGSTGEPKGVAVTHANLYNSTIARKRYYQDDPKGFLLFSSFSFDSSVAGIFWSLSSGGKLVISENRLEQDMEKLGTVIKNEKVTHTLLLPGLYKEILYSIDKEYLKTLKNVILAGEAIDQALPALHFKNLEDVHLFNEYGPTEATVWASVEKITDSNRGKITIGKPIGNTQIFILDNDMQPLPVGIPGEIYIGGLNVTMGYLNQPEVNSEKFVKSPFNRFPGMLYKTGDLAKFTPDGKIDFMGRMDGQVKIRGHRIELKEIESKINHLPDVNESIVIIDGDQVRNNRLICYYMAERAIESSEFRSCLEMELPDFMIPNHYILLDKLPRLPNGKLDRKKLPELSSSDQKVEFESPASESEQIMVEIWQEVLKLHEVGVNDNFFELGGDSISSIRIISNARERKFDIEPNQIFKYPTIRELVDHIGFDESKEVFDGEAPMSPYQLARLRHENTMDFKGFRSFQIELSQKLVEKQIVEITSDLIQKHDALRIMLPRKSGGDALYFASKKAEDHIAYCRELNQLKEIFQEDKQKRLFMLVGISKDAQEQFHSLVLLGHPLIIDDESWNIILTDFLNALDKRAVQLPESNQKGFANWLQLVNTPAFLQKLDKDLIFWQKQLNAYVQAPPNNAIREHNDESVQYDTELLDIVLPENVNSAFNTTFAELLMAGFVKTLADFHQKEEILVWLEKSVREDINITKDYSGTVGCFKARFPLPLTSKEEIKDLIVGTKEGLRRVPSQGMGYEHLVNANKLPAVPLDAGFAFQLSNFDPDNLDQFNGLSEVQELKIDPFDGTRKTHLRLNCIESGNSIQFIFMFDVAQYRTQERRSVLEIFFKNTRDIFDFCLTSEREYSTTDFPDANLSGDDLDELMKQLGE